MKHEESAIQRALCRHLELRGAPGLLFFSVPMGGRRNAREAGRLKAEGARRGVSDLILIHKNHVFALEVKTRKGRLSPEQEEFLNAFNRATGGNGHVAYGIDDALEWLERQGLVA